MKVEADRQAHHRLQIGRQFAHGVFRLEDREHVALAGIGMVGDSRPGGDRAAEGGQESWGRRHLRGGDRGEVEHDPAVGSHGGELPAPGVNATTSCRRTPNSPSQWAAGQRGVPAQRDLGQPG